MNRKLIHHLLRLGIVVLLTLVPRNSASINAQSPVIEGQNSAIVMLRSANARGDLEGTLCGAGIVLSSRNGRTLILTAQHVLVELARENEGIRKAAGQPMGLAAQFLGEAGSYRLAKPLPGLSSEKLDYAVLEVLSDDTRPLNDNFLWERLGDVRLPGTAPAGGDAFQDVRAVGNSGCKPWNASVSTEKVITASPVEIKFETRFVAEGSSGGGLFGADGSLVGLVLDTDGSFGTALPLTSVLAELRTKHVAIDLAPAPQHAVMAPAGQSGAPGGSPARQHSPVGTWEGTMSCGGDAGLRLIVEKVEGGRVLGYLHSFKTLGGLPMRDQCNAVLGTYEELSNSMSVRAQVPGQAQSLTDNAGGQGVTLAGRIPGDRYAGRADYLGKCTSFVLMRTDSEPQEDPACDHVLPPNPYASLPVAEVSRHLQEGNAQITTVMAELTKKANSRGSVSACSSESIEGHAAFVILHTVGDWFVANPRPPSSKVYEQSANSINLVYMLKRLPGVEMSTWNDLPCRSAMKIRASAFAQQLSASTEQVSNASRVLQGLP